MSEVGVKFKAYPTKEQQVVFSQWMGCARFIYNAKCDEDKYFRIFSKKSLSLVNQKPRVDQAYSQFKSKLLSPWLYEVPSQVLRNASVRWYDAYQRYFKGLSGRPTKKSNYGRQSVWLTSELFQFHGNQLWIGTKKKPIGYLKFKAHRSFKIPKSITLAKHAGFWSVSFCYNEPGMVPLTPEEIFKSYASTSQETLSGLVLGIDRGVAIPFATSSQTAFDFSEAQKKHLLTKERRRKKYQKRMANQQKGSHRRARTRHKIARCYQKAARVREDFAHKTSYQLVNSEAEVFAFEALKIINMTKKPEKQWSEEEQRYLPNRAKAKAGLNKKILGSSWRQTMTFLVYKAKKQNKCVIEVASHYSSQTCAECQYTCSSSRQSQSDFVCVACGHQDHADYNAARVIQQRGITALRSQTMSCVVGGTSKTKNGRGAKKKPAARQLVHGETPAREEASKEKSLTANAA